MSQVEQMFALASRAVELYGRIDTWVHAAAVSVYAPFQETRPEEFRRLIEVNLLGQAFGALAALPHLKRAGGGALIHIGPWNRSSAFLCTAPMPPPNTGWSASSTRCGWSCCMTGSLLL